MIRSHQLVSIVVISAALGFCVMLSQNAFASPADIVAQGASSNDWMASLAADGLLGMSVHPSDFTTDTLHTREQFAKMLEVSVLNSPSALNSIRKSTDKTAILRQLITNLRPELVIDGYDVKSLLGTLKTGVLGGSLTLQPEQRFNDGASGSHGAGTYGIYRADAVGTAGRDLSYTLSLSNWYQDWRRDIFNDLGDKDFDIINEGYFEVQGKHNFDIKVGEMYDNWGAASMGATMLSGNTPAFPQIEYTTPFSLGKHFGRNWRRTQTIGSFDQAGQRKYFQARSLEYDFSSHWSADYQEALLSDSASSLLLFPFPYLIGKNLHGHSSEPDDGSDSNIDITYSANPDTRIYGELLIDDFKSPFRGHFLGLSLGNGGTTPQKLAYVIGGTAKIGSGTQGTLEFSDTNQTTYSFHTSAAPWTHGVNDWIGLPTGPNAVQVYGRLSQKFGKDTSITVDGRKHWRRDNTYPAPSSSEIGVYFAQQLNQRAALEIDSLFYRQDPFPYKLMGTGYPANDQSLAPFAFADTGFYDAVNQVDVSLSISF